MRTHAGLVQQRDERLVVAHAALAQHGEFRARDGRRTEKLQGLIDEVAAEVEGDARPFRCCRGVLPAVAQPRRPPLEGRFEPVHPAESSLLEQLANGEKVPVPATILEDDERSLCLLGRGDQLLGF